MGGNICSTKGTQVNGVSLTDAELKDGDKIQFGSVVAVFCEMLPQRLMKQTSRNTANGYEHNPSRDTDRHFQLGGARSTSTVEA